MSTIDRRAGGGLAGALTLKDTPKLNAVEVSAKAKALAGQLVGAYASLQSMAPTIMEAIAQHIDARRGDDTLRRGLSIPLTAEGTKGSISLDTEYSRVIVAIEETSDYALRKLKDASFDSVTMKEAIDAVGSDARGAMTAAFGMTPNLVGVGNASLHFAFPLPGLQALLDKAAEG
jgi:hypothetical protein